MSLEKNTRYAVGIDLGTTHCVLSYLDQTSTPKATNTEIDISVLPIPQLTQPGVIEEKSQLPSFIYQAHESELSADALTLPWQSESTTITGAIARQLGIKTPLRLVSSAKSWLCHNGIDRQEALLPMGSPDEVTKISPLHATIAYLNHLRNAWNHKFPNDKLSEQNVTITIPASFDPSARELTAEAASQLNLNHLTLLEEPQAAVYNWIKASGNNWREQVSLGDIILVVDIGGGTCDLSLIAVSESNGDLTLNRVAVGDHILLGGDNMDLALAYRVKAKLAAEGKELQPWQVQAIVQACRDAKEQLLLKNDTHEVPIAIPSRGSKLLGGTLRTSLTRDEVNETLIEGFFPHVAIDEHPAATRRSALSQRGLPYAQDPAISRHLAAFLTKQADAARDTLGHTVDSNMQANGTTNSFIQPTAILFNGGVLKSPTLAERMLAIVNGWLESANAEKARLLNGADLDLGVSIGACYFGHVKQGNGVRIRGGLASTYYVGIESAMPAIPGMEAPIEALCIAPFGMEEGSEAEASETEFGLVVGEPVHFRFFGSKTRRHDQAGLQLDHWQEGELEELPELQATLPAEGRKMGEIVPVHLVAKVTEVGTLKLEAIAVNSDHKEEPQRWQIELDVRDS